MKEGTATDEKVNSKENGKEEKDGKKSCICKEKGQPCTDCLFACHNDPVQAQRRELDRAEKVRKEVKKEVEEELKERSE